MSILGLMLITNRRIFLCQVHQMVRRILRHHMDPNILGILHDDGASRDDVPNDPNVGDGGDVHGDGDDAHDDGGPIHLPTHFLTFLLASITLDHMDALGSLLKMSSPIHYE